MADASLGDIKATFFIECDDLMETLLDGLSSFDPDNYAVEDVHALFRSVHSIKGGAGAFGLDHLVRFSHAFENVLDDLRNGVLNPSSKDVETFLVAADMLTDLIAAARDGGEVSEESTGAVIDRLDAISPDTKADSEESIGFEPLALGLPGLELEQDVDFTPQRAKYHPEAHHYQIGQDPIPLLGALDTSLRASLTCDISQVPGLKEIDPEQGYLSWTLLANDEAEMHDLSEHFEFAEGAFQFEANEPGAKPVEALAVAEVSLDAAPTAPDEAPAIAPTNREAQPKATVRVDLERVDRLVNLVGELVIAQSMLSQFIKSTTGPDDADITAGLDDFMQLTRDIQDSVMLIRAQPVKSLFQRMGRIVRETASATGKSVQLVTEGDTTEIDKTVLEKLTDPLMHMVRNAIDHGLEDAETRLEAGKPQSGTVRLSAAHRSGRVVIDVIDDGAGLNPDRILNKAVQNGLVAPDQHLTEAEIYDLLFQPGFSTVENVSDLSGRGVGMDVVRKGIQSLGGTIAVSSDPGLGSRFSLSLPLTLAILDGMLLRAGTQHFVLPLAAVVETLWLTSRDVTYLDRATPVFNLRNEAIPVVVLEDALGLTSDYEADFEGAALVIQPETGERYILCVDEIEAQRQVVIKGIDESFGPYRGISAATILGDGSVSLILDPHVLGTLQKQKQTLMEREVA